MAGSRRSRARCALSWSCSGLARGRADSCAPYSYPAAAFGPGTGFVVAWSYWISCWVGNAALAVAAVQNLAFIWPGLAAPGIAMPASLAVLWLFTFVNCLGVREAGKVQVLTAGLKLLPLAGVILVAFWLLLRGTATPVAYTSVPIEAGSINSAATLALFAMLSFESAMCVGDRVENPERNRAARDDRRNPAGRAHLSALRVGGDVAAAPRGAGRGRARRSRSSSRPSSSPAVGGDRRASSWRSPRWAR